ncbi:MAG TPA: hypothetical protein VMZ53_07975 [Kofleriaceae bacterium]|nr:hypothetical protein [Kofleriaceae bacterium]
MQGTVGYVLIAVGVIVGFLGTARSERAAARDPDGRDRMLGALRKAKLAVVVIAVAIALYLAMRHYGHGRLGLQICTAILGVNATAVAVLKMRAAGEHLSGDNRATFKRFAIAEAIGYILVFAGIYLYLTR